MLNRSVLLLRPKQPYKDWLKSAEAKLKKSGHGEFAISAQEVNRYDFAGNLTAYLVPSCDESEDVDALIEARYEEFFERELSEWYTDPSLWPQPRTEKLFRQWFALELHAMTVDMGDDDIIDDEKPAASLWSKIMQFFGFGR